MSNELIHIIEVTRRGVSCHWAAYAAI
jgi:hypothetical protein